MAEEEMSGEIREMLTQSIMDKAFGILYDCDGINGALAKYFKMFVDDGYGIVIKLDDELKMFDDTEMYILTQRDGSFGVIPITEEIRDDEGKIVEICEGDIIALSSDLDEFDDDFDDEE